MNDNPETETIDEMSNLIQRMRRYAPYRFSGKWFISQLAEKKFKAYRTKSSAEKNSSQPSIWILS